MTTLLLLALLILAPTTAFTQTGPAAASEPQPTSSANHRPAGFTISRPGGALAGAVRAGVGRRRHRRDVERAGRVDGFERIRQAQPCEGGVRAIASPRCSGIVSRTSRAVAPADGHGRSTRSAAGSSRAMTRTYGGAGVAVHRQVRGSRSGDGWYPQRYGGSDGVREGFVGIGVNAALNMAREFAPELIRLIPFRSVNPSHTPFDEIAPDVVRIFPPSPARPHAEPHFFISFAPRPYRIGSALCKAFWLDLLQFASAKEERK